MTSTAKMDRAARYGQDDDDAFCAAWADVEHRPYTISGTGKVLHRRDACGQAMGASGPKPNTEFMPRAVFLTAEEAAAFLDEFGGHRPCGLCGPGGWLDHLTERRPHRHVPCGLGWP